MVFKSEYGRKVYRFSELASLLNQAELWCRNAEPGTPWPLVLVPAETVYRFTS
jgi:hypothetical protein